MTLVLSVAQAQQSVVWVVLAEEGGVYAETAAALRGELGDHVWLTVGAGETALDATGLRPELVVTVGSTAFERTLRWLAKQPPGWSRVPVLATLLPRAAYEAHLTEMRGSLPPVSAVVLDQPLGRQMALIKRALPSHARVGVLPGPQTLPLLKELDKEARARGLQLVAGLPVNAAEDVFPSLRDTLSNADVLLALPDPLIYHGASLQNILLTTYRARVPMVAFSAGYVRAGAMAAVYSTPAQVGRQTAALARRWLSGRGMPPVQTPREFEVATNPRVAASLGLALDEANRIADDLRRAEGQ